VRLLSKHGLAPMNIKAQIIQAIRNPARAAKAFNSTNWNALFKNGSAERSYAAAPWSSSNGPMPYREFFKRFGGSARSKNLRKAGLGGDFLPAASGLPREFIRLCPWEMEFLYSLGQRVKKAIVEVGRFNGGSTFLLACACVAHPIHSIDIAPKDDALLQSLFRQHGVGANVRLIVGDSQHGTFEGTGEYDLLFIDADHSREGCAADIQNWFGNLEPGGYIVFHDSYLDGEGAQEAICDFMESQNDLQIIASPLIGTSYWRNPTGSMACFRKRA